MQLTINLSERAVERLRRFGELLAESRELTDREQIEYDDMSGQAAGLLLAAFQANYAP